jgi:hypothetical protein
MLTIMIRYKTKKQLDWQTLSVSPADYFWVDPDLAVQSWDVDSAPKHGQAVAYLPVPRSSVLYTVVRVENSTTQDYWEVASEIVGANSSVSITTAKIEGRSYRELVFTGDMPLKDNGSQVLRVNLSAEIPQITMNTLMWGPAGDDESLNLLRSQSGAPAA